MNKKIEALVKKTKELRLSFKKETGENYLNSQDEPDIDYVAWLENKIFSMSCKGTDFETELQKELSKLPFTKGVDDGQYNEGVIDGFEMGARWAIKIKTV